MLELALGTSGGSEKDKAESRYKSAFVGASGGGEDTEDKEDDMVRVLVIGKKC